MTFCQKSAMMIKCLKISDDDKTDSGLAMMIKLTCGIGISDDDKTDLKDAHCTNTLVASTF